MVSYGTRWLYFVLCSKCYVILVANDWKKWADMWWFLVTIWNLDCKHLNSHWMTEKWSECTNLLLSGFLQPQSGSSSFMAFENSLLNHISWSLFMKQKQLFYYALGTELRNEKSQKYEHACMWARIESRCHPALFIHHHHWNIYSWQSWQKIDHSKLATRRQKNGFLHLFPFHPSSDLFTP